MLSESIHTIFSWRWMCTSGEFESRWQRKEKICNLNVLIKVINNIEFDSDSEASNFMIITIYHKIYLFIPISWIILKIKWIQQCIANFNIIQRSKLSKIFFYFSSRNIEYLFKCGVRRKEWLTEITDSSTTKKHFKVTL